MNSFYDPMSQFEEKLRRKEEAEIKELTDTIVLDDLILTSRDLLQKGKDVHPSAKQRKIVQTVAQKLKFNQMISRRKSTGMNGTSTRLETIAESSDGRGAPVYFDLNSEPRIYITSGPISKLEPDNILRRYAKRFLFLFNDVIILCNRNNGGKREGEESYEVQQVLWARELRIRSGNYFSDSSGIAVTADSGTKTVIGSEGAAGAGKGKSKANNLSTDSSSNSGNTAFAFELIVAKTRKRPQYSIVLMCEDDSSKRTWVAEIEAMLLAYHRDEKELSRQPGWYYEILQGSLHSAAYQGDLSLLRKHLRDLHSHQQIQQNEFKSYNSKSASVGIDAADEAGMTALHWAALRGHEVCVRLLLDWGADVDALQKGLNTPLLLAAVAPVGVEVICRLLIERGADLTARNLRDLDVVFMAVLYGHAAKGLPWLLQLLNAKGLDLNCPDGAGATPLHLCARRNLARPVRMLVDSGADVNAKHLTTLLTPLHMACECDAFHEEPDVETIRSFLDKGAYPNWRDSKGRTAFDIVLHSKMQQQRQQQQSSYASTNDQNAAGLSESLRQIEIADGEACATGTVTTSSAAGSEEYEEDEADDSAENASNSSGGASFDGDDPYSRPSTAPTGTLAAFGGGSSSSSSRSVPRRGSLAGGFRSYSQRHSNRNSNSNNNSSSSSNSNNNNNNNNTRGGSLSPPRRSNADGTSSSNNNTSGGSGGSMRWRNMEKTIEQVGDWAVTALPALLEISKRGGAATSKYRSLLQTLRPSFRAAVEEAQQVWLKLKQPANFLEFVQVRELSGEDLRLHQAQWTKNKESAHCQLCGELFGLRVRRHHCRGCGVLCCDVCSSKRLVLTAATTSTAAATPPPPSHGNGSNSGSPGGGKSNPKANEAAASPPTAAAGSPGGGAAATSVPQERVCDGCFNRLCFEAAQPSPDHFRVKQLKRCAEEAISSLQALVGALDSPTGGSSGTNSNNLLMPGDVPSSGQNNTTTASFRSSFSFRFSNSGSVAAAGNSHGTNGSGGSAGGRSQSPALLAAASAASPSTSGRNSPAFDSAGGSSGGGGAAPATTAAATAGGGEALIAALKLRDTKLSDVEDVLAKFLEASEGYHKITKRLIEQKQASNRLWGGNATNNDND